MNVFIISPGRTGTTTFSKSLKKIEGYTSSHESRVDMLGDERINYPLMHIECDNRLVFFLPSLTEKFCKNSVLVCLNRNPSDIALSYNKRWQKINIMKAYSQGILMRRLNRNNQYVCRDYVDYCYFNINWFSKFWNDFICIELESPVQGVELLLKTINKESYLDAIIKDLEVRKDNTMRNRLTNKLDSIKFNLECLIHDLWKE